MREEVIVTKSESGKWWRLSYRGKVEFVEEEPGESHKIAFRKSVDALPRDPSFSGNGRGMVVKSAENGQVVEQIK